MKDKCYIAIDLKSFYASVECIERGLDPLNTNLVVADSGRTEKTICLAVSPSLKALGIPGRPRLYEVVQKVHNVNTKRGYNGYGKKFSGESYVASELNKDNRLKVDYIVAPPRMALYTKYSTDIYKVYLKYIAPEDIHVYSIDEVFIDATKYLKTYQKTPIELAMTMINDVLKTTGITATAGIGTNMYLCKIAMDIKAKKMKPDKNGVRIAELDEMSYRQELWNHTPLTDFWRVGKGIAKRLEGKHIYTMGQIARTSLTQYGEDMLYKLFGVNAELLIDHAWGWEPCVMEDVKSYKPETNSLSTGQVLKEPYNYEKTKLIVKEMTELLVLDIVSKNLVTNQIVLTIGYDVENLTNSEIKYKGEITTDMYGRSIPKHAHGTATLQEYTSSTKEINEAVQGLFERIINKELLVRRVNIAACRLIDEKDVEDKPHYEQIDLFTDYEKKLLEDEKKSNELKKEKSIQKAIISIKDRFGKNAILKGMNLEEGGTTIERNGQIGGHKV